MKVMLNMDLHQSISMENRNLSVLLLKCNKVESNDSMKPTKLKQQLKNVHPQHKGKYKVILNVI